MGLWSIIPENFFRVFIQRVFEGGFGIDFQLLDEIRIVPELCCLFIWDSLCFPFSVLAPTVINYC